jgi:hypothetical protein
MRSGRLSTTIRTTLFPTSAAFAIAMMVSSGTALAQRGFVRSDGVSSVVWYDVPSRHIHELFLLDDGWHQGDLTAQAGAVTAACCPAPYVRSDGFNAVVFSGIADGHIYEIGLYGDGWHVGDMTAQFGAPVALNNLAPYVRSDGFNAVVYLGSDPQDIYELGLYQDGWHAGDLSTQAGAPGADYRAPMAPYVRSDGVNAVVYKGLDNHIYELALYPDGWGVGDLTAQVGAPLADFGPAPYVRSDGFSAVVYSGSNGHIYELGLYADGWHAGDLTAQAGAPLPYGGFIGTPYVRGDGINAVVYTGQNGHIYELYLYPRDGRWHYEDLTALAGS